MEKLFEERLRERASVGDIEGVQDLLNLGIDVNAREPGSGWYLSFQLRFRTFMAGLVKLRLFHLDLFQILF